VVEELEFGPCDVVKLHKSSNKLMSLLEYKP